MTLTKSEQYLLSWLAKGDAQYGECHGQALERLLELGLAQVHDEASGLHNQFIAKGQGLMYRTVSITEAGRAQNSTQIDESQ